MDDAAYSLFVSILFCVMLKEIYSGLERSQHVQMKTSLANTENMELTKTLKKRQQLD